MGQRTFQSNTCTHENGLSTQGKLDPTCTTLDDNPRIVTHINAKLDAALTKIHDRAVKEALSPGADDDAEILLAIPKGPWTAEDTEALEAAVKYYTGQAEAYRDNPQPVGRACSDTSAYLRWFQSAIPTGRHRDVLHRMPQWQRHILETCRTAGGEILMPHPAHEDSTPRFLRESEIARRAGIDLMPAREFARLFRILELNAATVEHYTTAMRRYTRPDLFKPSDLARDPGVHPDLLAMQLAPLAAEMINLIPDDVLTEGRASLTPFYDADLGRADQAQVIYEALPQDAAQDLATVGFEDPEILDDMVDAIGTPELVATEGTDEEDEMYLADGDDAATEGQYETIGYHRQGHGDNEEDPLDGDPLYEQIRVVTPQKVATVKKLLWQEQKAGTSWTDKANRTHFRSRAVWTYLWLILKAKEEYFADRSIILKRALRAMDTAPTLRALRHLGAKMYGTSKQWPAFARKTFWAQYNKKKEAYAASASLQPTA